MEQKKYCPQCKTDNIKFVEYMGVQCLVCNQCGYDERETYDVHPGERQTQREKTKFTPYRTGGGKRTLK